MISKIHLPSPREVARGNRAKVPRVTSGDYGSARTHGFKSHSGSTDNDVSGPIGIYRVEHSSRKMDDVVSLPLIHHVGQRMDKGAIWAAAHNGEVHPFCLVELLHSIDSIFDHSRLAPRDSTAKRDERLLLIHTQLILEGGSSARFEVADVNAVRNHANLGRGKP